MEAGLSPNVQRADPPGVAALSAQVQTFDADEGPLTIVGKAAEQVFLDFDNDMEILPAGASATEWATRQCTAADFTVGSFDSSSTAQVADACGDAIVGSGQAEALLTLPPPHRPDQGRDDGDSDQRTLTTEGGPCVAPAPGQGGPDGCEYEGGNPQIILHAYNQGLSFIETVEGEIQDSPAGLGADYGSRLAVNNAPDTAGDAGR